MADKSVRDEIAELTEAVRELRDREVADELRSLRAEVEKLRAERDGCRCTHVHWHPYTWTIPGTVTYPNYVVTSGTATATTTNYLSTGDTGYTAALGN